MGLQELGEHAIAKVGLHENLVDLEAFGELGETFEGLDAVPLAGWDGATARSEGRRDG